jgi:2-isopropylmalate synthase
VACPKQAFFFGKQGVNMTLRKPFFYDVTLRDGNQALARPWNLAEKERVFRQLLKLGVQGIEVGFAGASEMDFEACAHLAKIAAAESPQTVIASLARAVKNDLEKAAEAVLHAPNPRIHTFIALSPFTMENVLRMEPAKVKEKAVEAVAYAKKLLGPQGSVQFSAEHFGDCRENLDFVIEVFHAVIEAGADTINLPNTVERYRPRLFVDMVEKVVQALPKHVTVAVHTHNDLGMATATTVESYFVGAAQMECALNGLGERAGNTNFYEVAVALYNCEVDVGLNLEHVYETALLVSEWADLPIYVKAPLIGSESVAHRSGIHQDGATKTKGMKKGAYRPIDYSIIGRSENDVITFTSQSGRTAVFEILRSQGYEVSLQEASELQPLLKQISEQEGELSEDRVLEIFKNERINVTERLKFQSVHTEGDEGQFHFRYALNGVAKERTVSAEGPIEACLRLMHLEGHQVTLDQYRQSVVTDKDKMWGGRALSEITLSLGGRSVLGRGVSNDTLIANMKAVFSAVNLLVHS